MTVGPSVFLNEEGYGRIWSTTPRVTQEGLLSTISAPGDALITSSSFSAGAENLAVVDSRGQIHVLRLKSNRFSLLTRAGQPCENALFSRRNKKEVLVSFADHVVRSYSIDQGQLQGTLKAHRTPVTSLSVRSTTDELLTCSADGIVLWDLRRLVRKRTMGGGQLGAVQALFTEDGEFMVTAFRDDSVWVWDATSCALRYRVRLPFTSASPGALQAVAVSPDSTLLVAAGASPLLFLYDFPRGFLKHALRLPSRYALRGVRALQFAPDSCTLAVLTLEGSVLFVDVQEARLTALIPCQDPKAAALHLALDERHNLAALASLDGRLRLYDLGLLRSTYAAVRDSEGYRLAVVGAGELGAAGPESQEQIEEKGAPLLPEDTTPGVTLGMALASGRPTPHVPSLEPRRGETKGWRAEAAPAQMFRASVTGALPAQPTEAPPKRPASAAKRGIRPDAGLPSTLALSKLKTLLEGFGEYPEKYRAMIWRRLLALPGNTAAFQALASRGLHPAFEDLGERYPLPDRALLSRLARTLSAMAHWCPALAEVPYLPALAFPFVKLFGADELGCFEALASLWLHWFRGWLDNFPAPPVSLLSKWEAVLGHVDPELHAAMMARGGGVQGHVWCLLQTALSEVLTRKEWLKLWDHALTGGPHFLGCFLVAYLGYFREILLSVRAEEQVALFLRRPNALDLNAVVRAAYEVRMRTPEALLPPVRARETLPADAPVYPPYTAFPALAVDLASKEREKILQQEKELARRRVLVQELEERGRALAAQEQAWVTERARLAELEADRRQALRLQEEALAKERLVLDDRARGERLKQVAAVEDAYRTNLQRLRADWQVELERLRSDIEHKQKLMELEMQGKREEEVVSQLEFQAQQRVWAMEEEASRAAAAQRLRTAVEAAQVDEWAAKSKAQARWEREDGELRAKVVLEGNRKARMVQLESELAAREQTEALLAKKRIATEGNLTAIEASRRLRHLEEQAALLESEKEAAKRARAAIRSGQDREHFQRELEQLTALQEQKAAALRAVLEEAEELRRVERGLREERGEEVEHAMRRRELSSQLDEYRRAAERESAREERETRRLLEVLEEERRRDRDLEVELRLKEEELASRLQYARQVGERQTAAEEDERKKFGQMREALRNRLAQEEGEAKRRHEEAMAQLAVERERQLLELDAMWRKTAASEELRALAAQKAALDRDLGRRAEGHVERERILALEVEALKRKVEARDIQQDPPGPYPPQRAVQDLQAAERELVQTVLGGKGKGGKGKGKGGLPAASGKENDESVSITNLTQSSGSGGEASQDASSLLSSPSQGSSADPYSTRKAPEGRGGKNARGGPVVSDSLSGATPSDSTASANTDDLLRYLTDPKSRAQAGQGARVVIPLSSSDPSPAPTSTSGTSSSGDSLLPPAARPRPPRTAGQKGVRLDVPPGAREQADRAPAPRQPRATSFVPPSSPSSASIQTDELTRDVSVTRRTTGVAGPFPASDYAISLSTSEDGGVEQLPPPAETGKALTLPGEEEEETSFAPLATGGARAGPSHPPVAAGPEGDSDSDAEFNSLMRRMKAHLEGGVGGAPATAPPASLLDREAATTLQGSPPFTVSASTLRRHRMPQSLEEAEEEDDVVSGVTAGAGREFPGEGPEASEATGVTRTPGEPTPRHTAAYLQAKEILDRHRKKSSPEA